MQRFKATCAYDGTDFDGWQSQPSGKTIQDILEKRLSHILEAKTRIQGSGRTDSGVHARGQVFHFDAPWKHGTAELIRALRSGIPKSIQVSAIEHTDADFHARFSAKHKHYSYHLFEGYPDPFEYRYTLALGNTRLHHERLHEAAQLFIGTHDFTAFSADRRDGKSVDPTRTLSSIKITTDGPKTRIDMYGTGFLYKMARRIAGTLLEIARGKLPLSAIPEHFESRQRTHFIQTAPAHGLFLEHVYYVDPPAES